MDKIKYYLIQWTWGLPMNILGLIMFIAAKTLGWRTYMYRKAVCIATPWKFVSAVSLGMFIMHGPMCTDALPHEYGHSIQNMNWGWSFLFTIGIPSFIRCWYHNLYYMYRYPKTRKPLPDYYSIWFEKEANELGAKAEKNTWSWI